MLRRLIYLLLLNLQIHYLGVDIIQVLMMVLVLKVLLYLVILIS